MSVYVCLFYVYVVIDFVDLTQERVYMYEKSYELWICLSPWYNRTGWLGVKHQLTYLREFVYGGV